MYIYTSAQLLYRFRMKNFSVPYMRHFLSANNMLTIR